MRQHVSQRIPQELVDKALKWSVLDFFNQFKPDAIKRVGNSYRMVEHPSFVISLDGWLFDWKSQNISGKGAIAYLQKCEEYSFKDAVSLLSGENIELASLKQRAPQQMFATFDFVLPERSFTNQYAINYLSNRGVSKTVIDYCISNDLLYQTKEYNGAVLIGYDNQNKGQYITRDLYNSLTNQSQIVDLKGYCIQNNLLLSSQQLSKFPKVFNVCFVGVDGDGVPKYAQKRGLNNKIIYDQNGKEKNVSFRQEVGKSDKRFSFALNDISGKSTTLHLFEAAIDLLSYASLIELYDSNFKTKNMLSLGGASAGKNNTSLSDNVTLPLALEEYLTNKNSQIKKVFLHLDNDEVGIKCSQELAKKLKLRGYDAEIKLPPSGKDFNDFLQNTLSKLEANRNISARELLQQRR